MTLPPGAYSLGGITSITDYINAIIATRNPTSADVDYELGQTWINKSANTMYVLTSFSTSSGLKEANWQTSVSAGVSTLTGDTGGAISPVAGNINIFGGDTVTVDGAGDTLTINASEAGFPITPYVVGPAGQAGYQTIQSAITAADGAGGNACVYIQPGTYTENLTFASTVDLVGESDTGVIIVGVHTPPASGTIEILNCTLSSATHIFSSVAAGTTDISCINCTFDVTNGFVFNLASWTGDLIAFQCGAIGANDGFVNNTGGSTIFVDTSNVGVGTGQTMVTTGVVLFEQSNIGCPINHQTGSDISAVSSSFTRTVTFSNNSTGSISNSAFFTGATAAITMSSSAAVFVSTTVISSSNNPAIAGAGAGTLTLTDVSFLSNSSTAGTLTLAWGATKTGSFTATGTSALAAATAADTMTIGSASQTGTITLGQSTAGQTVSISSAINVGAQVVNIANGASGADTTVRILSGNATAGTQLLNLAQGTGGKIVNVATDAGTNVVAMGSTNGASSLTLRCGTGNFSLDGAATSTYTIADSQTSGTIQIGGSGLATGTIEIAPGTGDQSLLIANDTGIKTIEMGSTGTSSIIIGSTDTVSSMVLRAGTGNMSISGAATTNYTFGPSTTSGTFNIGGTGANTGTATIFGGTGAQTVNIANSTGGKTVSIATGAGANTVTLGSTNTTSTTNINAGSGGIVLAGVLSLVAAGAQVRTGSGSPNGAVTAPVGSIFMRTDPGAANERLYINTDGVTTWASFTASA